jgi:Cu+-exporting ATPase
MIRLLGRNGLYLKNASAIEALAGTDLIIFDKTGTISQSGSAAVEFEGTESVFSNIQLIRTLARQSNHALSRAIVSYLPFSESLKVVNYTEYPGRGAEGIIQNKLIRMGSSDFLGIAVEKNTETSNVYVQIDGKVTGCFRIRSAYREGIEKLISDLKLNYTVALLSGDNDSEKDYLIKLFGSSDRLAFSQSPEDKLNYIEDLQKKGSRVVMIGDGLNDSGALMQSDAGIALSDDINNFSPACDAILSADRLSYLPRYLAFAKAGKVIIVTSFIISLVYNLTGLAFAIQGTLSPVIAAILMPLSSISILAFTTIGSKLSARYLGLKVT